MYGLILFFVVFLIYFTQSDRLLRKKLKIAPNNWTHYKCVNPNHKRIELYLLGTFLLAVWMYQHPLPLFIAFFFILFCIRAYMEWKYEKEKKEYIMTLFSIFNYLAFLFIALYFNLFSAIQSS